MEAESGVALDVQTNRMQFTASETPLSPPPMLNPDTPTARRPSHPATSPLYQTSPNPSTLRRTTSATGLNDRSRKGLGAQSEDGEKRPTPKRSISNLISGFREAQAKMESIEEPVPLTAPQIAIQHFTRELDAHAESESTAETVVILHDACYGHRYSRPKTSKSTLSMIVERPERIHASVLGASTAYVRLGGHCAGAKNAPHPDNAQPAPPPFKIRRTGRSMDITSPYVTNVHGTAWMAELRKLCNAAGEKLAAGVRELSRSSTPTEPEKRKLHEGDLYLCSESLNAFQGALGAVADAVDTVFASSTRTKRAFVAIRPPGHHCSADHPSGFCWLNNVHVGIEYAAQTYGLTHAVILDFDLHHGDGSQAITWERNSSNNVKRLNAKPNSKLKLGPDIGYFSLHDINSYPCEMGDDEKVQAASLCIDNAHGQSIWNVHLQPWKAEKEFWELYETRYRILLDKARQFLRHHTFRLKAEGKVVPRAAVFISAGFDASEWEGAGMQRHKVNVPTEFYARFTRDVVELAEEEGTSCDGRIVSVLEGGYSDRALCSGVLSHVSGLCATPIEALKTESSAIDSLDQMMRGLGINGTGSTDPFYYNKAWWSPANLTALEMKLNPPPPPQAKKARIDQQPTYATPTESFAYKVVDANKFARSISGTMREVQQPARPPTPPPPEIDWIIATQELSKLLIPSDRQTKSCTPEELAGPKAKKDLTSGLATLSSVDSGKSRQLRDRKAKVPGYAESAHSDELESVRSSSRSSRRQTIAELPSSSGQTEPLQQRRASRRLSAGSALSSLAGDIDIDAPPVPALPKNPSRTAAAIQPPTVSAQGVQVKKTRAPAKKEATSSAPVSPKRSTKPPPRLSGPANTSAPSANGDVDALTADMKKVTLKVGSKEEHDRKQKDKIDAERRARALKAAETRKANAAAKKAARESSVTVAKPGFEHTAQQAKENTAPLSITSGGEPTAEPTIAPPAPTQGFMRAGLTVVETMLPNYSNVGFVGDVNALPATVTSDETSGGPFTQQQETHSQPPPVIRPTTPVEQSFSNHQTLPPNAEPLQQPAMDSAARQNTQEHSPSYPTSPPRINLSPLPARSPSGVQLPVWSSTGVIPFAMANGTPKETKGSPRGAFRQEENLVRDGNGDSTIVPGIESDGTESTSTMITEEKEASIWDVPDTPQG